jgi:hypothetical protein
MQLLFYRVYALGGSGRQLEFYWDGVLWLAVLRLPKLWIKAKFRLCRAFMSDFYPPLGRFTLYKAALFFMLI